MIFRALTALAAPAGEGALLSVFYFHRVLPRPDPLLTREPDARSFGRILDWIGAQFRVLDPLEACEALVDGRLPARPAVISFDDGYRDNHDVALPLLRERRMPAVFFVATAFLDGSLMFNDRVIEAIRHARTASIRIPPARPGAAPEELPLRDDTERRVAIGRFLGAVKRLPPAERNERVLGLERQSEAPPAREAMMRPEHVRALHGAGMRVGGHTRTHPILCATDDAEAEAEIAGGLDDLASLVGERPVLFAYPNGKRGVDYDERHVAMVDRAGCRFAFSTRAGAADLTTATLELPRFTPWDRTRPRFALRALRNLWEARGEARNPNVRAAHRLRSPSGQ